MFYLDPKLLESERIHILCYILWRIFLQYQEIDLTFTDTKQLEVQASSSSLMKWINTKLPDQTLTNWTSDWTDGVCLCKLVNVVCPHTIPEFMYRKEIPGHGEMLTDLVCKTAEDVLGIPEITPPSNISNGNVDAESMMIYVSMFRDADEMNKCGVDQKKIPFENDEQNVISQNEQMAYQPIHYVAFGSGLCWAQVGKSAEFFVKSNFGIGRKDNRLSISIECHPFDVLPVSYKPALHIKPLNGTTYLVRYTPTRPGVYVINVLCNGTNIANSPFTLNITECVLKPEKFKGKEIVLNLKAETTELNQLDSPTLGDQHPFLKTTSSTTSDDSRHDSAFYDDDSIRTSVDLHSDSECAPPQWLHAEFHEIYKTLTKPIVEDSKDTRMKVFGKGLHFGIVGRSLHFNVNTPNDTTGPLGVSVTCPAISLPVPFVKTKLHLTHFSHEILYIPTEPGIYEVNFNWGDLTLPGSPFHLAITNTENEDTADANDGNISSDIPTLKEYRDINKHDIYLYYSATAKDSVEHDHKIELIKLLRKTYPLDKIVPVAIDIDLSYVERKELYHVTNTRKLPFVFKDDTFLGTYDDVMRDNDPSLSGYVRRGSHSITTRLQRLSSSGSTDVLEEYKTAIVTDV